MQVALLDAAVAVAEGDDLVHHHGRPTDPSAVLLHVRRCAVRTVIIYHIKGEGLGPDLFWALPTPVLPG
jgi:hypothetical protein